MCHLRNNDTAVSVLVAAQNNKGPRMEPCEGPRLVCMYLFTSYITYALSFFSLFDLFSINYLSRPLSALDSCQATMRSCKRDVNVLCHSGLRVWIMNVFSRHDSIALKWWLINEVPRVCTSVCARMYLSWVTLLVCHTCGALANVHVLLCELFMLQYCCATLLNVCTVVFLFIHCSSPHVHT